MEQEKLEEAKKLLKEDKERIDQITNDVQNFGKDTAKNVKDAIAMNA